MIHHCCKCLISERSIHNKALYFLSVFFVILVMLCGVHFVSQVVWELYLAVRLSSWLLQSSYITELYWLRSHLESCLPETCQTCMMLLYYMKILDGCCVYIPGLFFFFPVHFSWGHFSFDVLVKTEQCNWGLNGCLPLNIVIATIFWAKLIKKNTNAAVKYLI